MTDSAGVPRKAALAAFRDADAAALLAVAGERRLEAGAFVWGADPSKRGLVVILEGRVELSLPTEFPERRVVMGIFGPGSVIGETHFFGGDGDEIIALAIESTRLAEFDCDSFAALSANHPETHQKLLLGLLKTLSRRIAKAYERMSSVF